MILKNLKKGHSYLNYNVENEGNETLDSYEHFDRLSRPGGGVSWDLSHSFHLRLLIHYVGDIH